MINNIRFLLIKKKKEVFSDIRLQKKVAQMERKKLIL